MRTQLYHKEAVRVVDCSETSLKPFKQEKGLAHAPYLRLVCREDYEPLAHGAVFE
jgi:hypothetical protein